MIPADALYKSRVLTMRGQFHTVGQAEIDQFAHGRMRFQKDSEGAEILSIAELTMATIASEQEIDTTDFLARVTRLADTGYYVLISEFFRFFRLRQYLARYTSEPVALITDEEGLGNIFREDYYDTLPGGILEGVGQSFPPGTTAYVYPTTYPLKSLADAPIKDDVRHLLHHLENRAQVVLVGDYEAM